MNRLSLFSSFRVLKDYIMVVFGTGSARALSFLTGLILARSLLSEGFGVFSLFFTLMTLVWQIPAVVDSTYVRYYKTLKERSTEVVSSAFYIKLVLSALLIVLAFPLARLLSYNLFNKPELLYYVFWAILSGTFLGLFSTLTSIYQAQEKFGIFSVFNFIFYLLVFLGVCFLNYLKLCSPFSVCLVYASLTFLMALSSVIYLFRFFRPVLYTDIVIGMMHFGKWLLAENLIYIVSQRMDMLVLGRVASYSEIGIYSAAVRLAMLAGLFTSAVSTIFMPKGCRCLESKEKYKAYFRESMGTSLLLSLLIGVMIAAAGVIIPVVFGQEYSSAVLASRILLADAVFIVLYTPYSYIFFAAGKTKHIFFIGVFKMIIMTLSLVLLVPHFGATGAALSICLASLAALVLVCLLSPRILKAAGINNNHSVTDSQLPGQNPGFFNQGKDMQNAFCPGQANGYFKQSNSAHKDSSIKVSVVIPVKNEEKNILFMLETLFSQSVIPDQVVITDGGSTDNTTDVVDSYIKRGYPIKLIKVDHAFPGKGRNIAIRNTDFDYIAMADAGVLLDKNWLKNLIEPFRHDPQLGVVYGIAGCHCRNKFEACFSIVYLPHGTLSLKETSPTLNAIAMKKSVWEQAGGFREDLRAAEDLLFFRQLKLLNIKSYFEPQAFSFWRPRSTLKEAFSLSLKYSACDALTGFHHSQYLRKFLTYALLFIFMLAGFKNPLFLLCVPAIFFLRALAACNKHRRAAWELLISDPSSIFLMMVVVATLDISGMAGYILGSFAPYSVGEKKFITGRQPA